MEIKALFLDFDGVFTDNKVLTDSNGKEALLSSKFDSLAIKEFRDNYKDFPIFVITSEENKSVLRRCKKLKLDVFTAKYQKVKVIKDICEKYNIKMEDVAFCGNDLNDLEALKLSGLSIAVRDAAEEVRSISRFVTRKKGGDGAVREILFFLMDNKFKFNEFNLVSFPLPKDMGHREWGYEKLLVHVKGKYTMKKLVLKKGARGGIQYHRFKDECGILLKGKLELRFTNEDSKLISKIIYPGEIFHFPPYSIHQEIAIEECEIIEVSNPIFNDRVKVEDKFNEEPQGGMLTTSIDEVIFS